MIDLIHNFELPLRKSKNQDKNWLLKHAALKYKNECQDQEMYLKIGQKYNNLTKINNSIFN